MVQVVEMTYEEKVKMYQRCTKTELVKMLIESNSQLTTLLKPQIDYTNITTNGTMNPIYYTDTLT